MSILVDICEFKAVAMHHIFAQQVMADPVTVLPLEPFEASYSIPDDEGNLGRASLDNLAGHRPRGQRVFVDENTLKFGSASMFKPITSADQVDLAVAVKVGLGKPFAGSQPGDRDDRPGITFLGIARWTRHVQDF